MRPRGLASAGVLLLLLRCENHGSQNPEEYFELTENAVKHAYAGLESCWAVSRAANRIHHHKWDPRKAE